MTLGGFPKGPNVFHLRPSSGGSLIKESICNLWNKPESRYPPNKKNKKSDIPAISRTNAPLGTLSPAVRSVSVCCLKRKMMKGPARGGGGRKRMKGQNEDSHILKCLCVLLDQSLMICFMLKSDSTQCYTQTVGFGHQRHHRKSLSDR